MKRIAVLLTCFNRKEETLSCLEHLYLAHSHTPGSIDMSIYLVDDGSTDGTGKSVIQKFPEVTVLQGNGELFWAGGMRKSWTTALERTYEAYLLLNDDTKVYTSLFDELLNTDAYSRKKFGQTGIYIGSTVNPRTNKLSYGGSVFTNRFLAKSVKLIPNKSTPQVCELGNANIMLVTKKVVDQIGILASGFKHGLADYDYTLMATKKSIPVLITPNFLGNCLNENKNKYSDFHELSFKKRLKLLNSPIGLDFKSNLYFMKRNFPIRWPMVYIAGWFKVIFPKFYYNILLKGR